MHEKKAETSVRTRKLALQIALGGPRNLILDNIMYIKTELPIVMAPDDLKEILSSLIYRLYDSVEMLGTANDLMVEATEESPEQHDEIKTRNLLVLEILHREIHVMDAMVRFLMDEVKKDRINDIGLLYILVSESMVNVFTAYGELEGIIQAW